MPRWQKTISNLEVDRLAKKHGPVEHAQMTEVAYQWALERKQAADSGLLVETERLVEAQQAADKAEWAAIKAQQAADKAQQAAIEAEQSCGRAVMDEQRAEAEWATKADKAAERAAKRATDAKFMHAAIAAYDLRAMAAKEARSRAVAAMPDWITGNAWTEASEHVNNYDRAVKSAAVHDRAVKSAAMWATIGRSAAMWEEAHGQAAKYAEAAGQQVAEVAPDWTAAGAWAGRYERAANVHRLAAKAIGAWVAARKQVTRAEYTAARERTLEARQVESEERKIMAMWKRVVSEACDLATKADRDVKAVPNWAAAAAWVAKYKNAADDASVDAQAGNEGSVAAGPEPDRGCKERATNRAAAHWRAAEAWTRAAEAAERLTDN